MAIENDSLTDLNGFLKLNQVLTIKKKHNNNKMKQKLMIVFNRPK